jgi:hypothetical protein
MRRWPILVAMLVSAILASPALADEWHSVGLHACVQPEKGGPTTLYSSPRQIAQEALGTVQPGEIYVVVGVSTRYRLLRATAHSGSWPSGRVVGWVWSIRLRPAPTGACS